MIPWLLALSVAAGPVASHEREARRLEAELIAPCCWTQQVSVHSSPAADKVRADVRARLAAGQTHQQILDAYVAEYGQAILAEPPARGSNLALYVAPPIVLAATAALLVVVVRRFSRRTASEAAPAATDAVGDPRLADTLDDELARLD
jgi:cytochrome c-type biogenesis protein CcmH/NrfF